MQTTDRFGHPPAKSLAPHHRSSQGGSSGQHVVALASLLPCVPVSSIEREPAAGMTHQFLHNLHILAVRDQERGVRMSKSVPADSFLDSGSSRCRLNDSQQQDIRPVRKPALGVWAGKYPIIGFRILARFLPEPEVGRHLSIERNRFSRGFSFAVPDHSKIDRTNNVQLQTREIYIAPLQCEQFAATQPRSHVQVTYHQQR